MLTRVLVCAYMAAARLVELAYSRRNIAAAGETVEGPWSRRTFPFIALLHAAVIAGTLLLGRRTHWPWLAALAAVQPLRAWALLTLGPRWNARAAVPKTMAVATGGPYAFVRHPNYAVVAVELSSLPAAFGLGRLAVAATLANGVLIALRLREEEAALFSLPGYAEHFGRRKRFLPGVF